MISSSVWTWFAIVITDSSMIARWSRDGQKKICRWIFDVKISKEQRWAPNMRGEEFWTIFIKSKMLLFFLYINNFNPDFQNFDFFLLSYYPFQGKLLLNYIELMYYSRRRYVSFLLIPLIKPYVNYIFFKTRNFF